ncbi:MAG: DNA-directed RNA polymerase subunit beta [Rickettsiaceae bacterium H1]|nr:DNA-directed RNA polymerase subunit beta [Rickettsiaceae bacterium H1]
MADYSSLSRVSFAKNFADDCIFPDLIKIQRDSYELFIYGDETQGKKSGLYNAFNSIFPIEENSGKATLEFVDCELGKIKYDEYECIERSITYSASLRALLRLVVWGEDSETKKRTVKNIKEQEVYVVDVPMMTSKGTFIINGFERVVVSQMHRSPGIFIDYNKSKSSESKLSYVAKVIPYRGSWLDFEFNTKGLVFFRVDKKRKLPVIILLRALGMSNPQILSSFYDKQLYKRSEKGWVWDFFPEKFDGVKLKTDLMNAKDGKIVFSAGSYVTLVAAKKAYEEGLRECLSTDGVLEGLYFAEDVICNSVKLVSAGSQVNSDFLQRLKISNIDHFYAVELNNKIGSSILNSILLNPEISYRDALFEIYNMMRPGESPTLESAKVLFYEMFFDSNKYNLSDVGRMKIGMKFNVVWDENDTILTQQDIILTIRELLLVSNGYSSVDDIDNLSNRRVRSVGEFIENQIRIGLVRMQRVIVEYMSSVDVDVVMPFDLVNSKILIAVIKEFFTSSPLSQFMDQTNPLSEITHKRRLSALGPGGLNRERAGFEVRDVHTSHRGRICPIETPEGQNIGLISSLATCARINKYGFIEAPYKKVEDGVVSNKIEYLSSIQDYNCNIAQANTLLDPENKFVSKMVHCRNAGEVVFVAAHEVDYIDLTPKQIVSIAASLIPFLENNDANRALMGSNMQRQAVPLLKSNAALVGTGVESLIAKGSGALIIAKHSGKVAYVNFDTIIISSFDKFQIDKYCLQKYQKSNDNTLINQKPLVKVGDCVCAGDVIADGVATKCGELALGCNLVVAFMSWKGYNFEDSIVISSRVVEEDMFTSIHIEEFECVARDTRLGPEEVTRDIPNVGEELLCNLDEYGIVHIGAEVESGDVLVGKVTPKSESFVTPEEKLLRAIFGEKAIDVSDSSLYLPPGLSGKVIDVRVFLRRGVNRDGRVILIEKQKVDRITKCWDSEVNVVTNYSYEFLKKLLLGKTLRKAKNGIIDKDVPRIKWWNFGIEKVRDYIYSLLKKVLLGKKSIEVEGGIVNDKFLSNINREKWWNIKLDNNFDEIEDLRKELLLCEKVSDIRARTIDSDFLESIPKDRWKYLEILELSNEIDDLYEKFDAKISSLNEKFKLEIEKVQSNDSELSQGVLRVIKVFIAVKHNLQPGDKMAGRHGNKGVISKIAAKEDMPYLEDGTPVDIVLNSLGIPSRMNVGQVLETHLGWACIKLRQKIRRMLQASELEQLAELLCKIYYKNSELCSTINNMSKSELVDFSRYLSNNLSFSAPVFESPKDEEISHLLNLADLSSEGQEYLYDGTTGERFDRKVTVGSIYMLKLHHLVDDKMHARSVGPYSLITQQPLGGKSYFGGQRFGEMECWALQAYGASYVLQEMLTIKSDDVVGRIRLYDSIICNDNNFVCGVPESFHVLVNELRALCLNIELRQDNEIVNE